jgi:hypothetical protein
MEPGFKQSAEDANNPLGGAATDTRAATRARRAGRKRSRSAGAKLRKMSRRLIITDPENLLAGPVTSAAGVKWIQRILEEHVGLGPEDQVVLGTCHVGLLELGIGWPAARRVVRSGPSGADMALIEVLREEHVADRFAEVVLVSGDGAFADVVAELAARGVPTTVVAQRKRLSAKLRLTASTVVEVPVPPPFGTGEQNFSAVQVIALPITDAVNESAK